METKTKNPRTGQHRRKPGSTPVKQKAPHAKPRKNPAPVQEPARVAPEVVYLAPKPFSRSRFILHLATVVAVVLALLLGLSIFFKVENIEVSGCNQYTAWQVQQASGIKQGDQLLTFSIPKAAALIRNELPYVKTVRIGISLPDTVKIEIVETQVAYGVEDTAGSIWLIDSDGKIVAQATPGSSYTKVLGVTIETPEVGVQARAHEEDHGQTDPSGASVPVTVTAAQRLDTATQIAQYLEQNGIIGQVASLDVSNLFEIGLWYGDRFQVLLGDTKDLNLKVSYLKGFVDDYDKNRPYESGMLDLSDPNWIEYDSFADDAE